MRLKIHTLVILLYCINLVHVSAQDTLFFENFDSSPDSKPSGWTTELELGESKWQFANGGGTKNPEVPGSGHPSAASSDTVNALYYYESLGGESVILITPSIDLEFAVKPELKFMLAQVEGNLGPGFRHDEMSVYYKIHFDSTWVEARKLAEYTDAVNVWTEQTILLPDEALVPECYFAFKAKTKYGWGVCIDDVSIIETGEQQRQLDTLTIHQESTNIIPSGTRNNQLLRIDISVKGNTGNFTLNSLDISSLNTSDADIAANGVKLFYNCANKTYCSALALDSASLSLGKASFNSLGFNLPTGYTHLWISYDLKQDAVHGNIADAKMEVGSIDINGSTFPEAEASPPGSRMIQRAVFFDDFSTDKGWTLVGDFERARPRGLGGNYLGNPDPIYAAGDTMILGNDITGLGSNLGDYESEIVRYGNLAASPVVNLFYYNDVKLNFLRWLNVANNDTASIEMSLDNGSTWSEIWSNNNNIFTDGTWTFISQSITDANRYSQVKFRINLGPTTLTDHFSGWNIENFSITGNYIDYDVGPTALFSPGSGCGYSSAETVSIRVENYGPTATPANIPVRYSFDGGATFTEDTLTSSIVFEGIADFDFSDKIDLSTPGIYDVVIESYLDVDEDPTNNSFDTVLYIDPTYTLPYSQDFEGGEDFWRATGNNTSFEYGEPGDIIHDAASGTKAWVTNLDGDHYNNEDGYLLGPCFDLSGIDYPVFEFKLFNHTKSDQDGANLEYSLNDGQSWSRVGNMGDGDTNYWNWYNTNAITSMPGGHGWTGLITEWVTTRILLDTAIFRDVSRVKFRFHFTSDGIERLNGIGIDDIRIYDAPRDIGVVSIEYPINGCSQAIGDNVAVTIRNFGLDTLMIGDTLVLGYDFDGEATIVDTFVLETNLLKNGTLPHTFKKPLTVSSSGTQDVYAFSLLSDDIDFYNDTLTNDTTSKSIDVTLTPFTYLPAELYSVRPDTIVLDAYTGVPEDTYLWQDSSTDSVFHVSANTDGVYSVIASNAVCDYRDTTYVYRLFADAGVTQIIEPASDCELGAAVQPRVGISNFGTDTIHIGDSIPVRYRTDGGTLIEEIAVLSQLVFPGDTFEYTFTASFDMSAVKSYDIVSFTDLPYDDTLSNDTLKTSVSVYGITTIDLGPDTIVRALNYTIDAGAGYDSYLWQDGSVNQTLLVDTSGEYRVTVKDGTKCENSDSLIVTIIIPDIAIERLNNPSDACGLSATENLDIYIINTGSDTLQPGDTLLLSYRVNSGIEIHDTLYVDIKVEPGDSVMFSSSETIDLSGSGTYQFTVLASYVQDLIPGNNSLDQSVEIFGNPAVSLGDDRVVYALSDTLDAGAGFTSYLWHDGSTNQQFIINYDERTPDSIYSVTVTDDNACEKLDEVRITFFTWDVAVESILSPTSACVLSGDEELRVLVLNSGTRTIVNEQLKIIASIDNGIPVTGQKTLTLPLEPGDSLVFIFDNKFDFSGEGDHILKTYSIYSKDTDPNNDTLSMIVCHTGKPPIDIGGTSDSLGTTLPHTLDAGADYAEYLWNGISGSRTYDADRFGRHTLEITDLLGCTAKDSVYLMQSTGLTDIMLPGELKVYPVPSNNILHIEYISDKADQLYLEIFDTKGGKILIKEYRHSDQIMESIDVRQMAHGIYYLILRSDRKQIIKRVVIE
jgi:hypothetical protein